MTAWPLQAPSGAAIKLLTIEAGCRALDRLWREAWAAEKRGMFEVAERRLALALRSQPNLPQAAMQMGFFHRRCGRTAEGEVLLHRALEGLPFELAQQDSRILQDRAAIKSSLAMGALASGDYTPEAWLGFEARHDLPLCGAPWLNPGFPAWRGEPIAGKSILVLGEQGFGDQIQFARFLPALRERGATVTFVCADAIAPLFDGLADNVIAGGSTGVVATRRHDFWAYLMTLPAFLDATTENLRAAPYIKAPEPRSAARFGVVTKGSPTHQNDAHRSLPRPLRGELLTVPGAISLHPEVTGARDFAETAEIIAGLELVITVDTSVAHLAGAMGKPVWIMLPDHGCDWRWMRDRTDSSWYPSAKLYRQPKPGDWRSVLDRVTADLASL